jgi:MFS superfamily sulfate permease-like transporter
MKLPDRWSPKLLLSFGDYTVQCFGHDVVAGVTVGLVALRSRWPLASPLA